MNILNLIRLPQVDSRPILPRTSLSSSCRVAPLAYVPLLFTTVNTPRTFDIIPIHQSNLIPAHLISSHHSPHSIVGNKRMR